MRERLGPNDPCPCGSGKKVKKCCRVRGAPVAVTERDRARFFELLEEYATVQLNEDFTAAFRDVWDDQDGSPEDLDPHSMQVSLELLLMWFALDEVLDDGKTPLDWMLQEIPGLPVGVRGFAERLRSARFRPYEVVEVVPGVSMTLRDLIDASTVTVAERSASRTISRHAWIGARVIRPGVSGKPEMERGVIGLPSFAHGAVRSLLEELRDAQLGTREFASELAYELHRLWIGCHLSPPIPELRNNDGEALLVTRVHYEVRDLPALERALGPEASLQRAGSGWDWIGPDTPRGPLALGRFELGEGRLTVETNSRERAERATHLLSRLAGDAVAHRATTHEDLEGTLRDHLKRRVAEGDATTDPAPSAAPIPQAVQEALVLDYMARHYHRWVDEPVPALDGATPRAAAGKAATRGTVVTLLNDLLRAYQDALRAGQPAYDPSWMWAELGLAEPMEDLPPPLAHERLGALVEGATDVVREVAEAIRRRPDFDDASTVLPRGAVSERLEVRRFLNDHAPTTDPLAPAFLRRSLAPYLELAVEHAVHRKKVFWIDRALTLMLSHTDVDMTGSELRAPFPVCAFVFTDRLALSLGERLLSHRASCPLAGQLLRVLTVYVAETLVDGMHRLDLTFAFDALGDDLPELVEHRLEFGDATPVHSLFGGPEPIVLVGATIDQTPPVVELARLVVNAMLFATSCGVEPVVRGGSKRPSPTRKASGRTYTSEEVYFLPGAIDIQQAQAIETLSRLGEGREALRRSMVRGHWRRAAKNWADQRPRWIAPYWKGPDMAAVIERAYRLRP